MTILANTQNPTVLMALKYFEVCQEQTQTQTLKNPIFNKHRTCGDNDLRIYRHNGQYYFNFSSLGKFVAVKLKDGLNWDNVAVSLRIDLGLFTPTKIMNYNGWVKVDEVKPVHDGENTVFMPLKVIHGVGEIPRSLQALGFKKRTNRWSAVIMQPAFGELAENAYWLHREITEFRLWNKAYINLNIYFRNKHTPYKWFYASLDEVSQKADEVIKAGAYTIAKKGDDYWLNHGSCYDDFTKVPQWRYMELDTSLSGKVIEILKRVTGDTKGELTWDIVKADIAKKKEALTNHKAQKAQYKQNLELLSNRFGYKTYQ